MKLDGAHIVTESFWVTFIPRQGPTLRISMERDEVVALIALLQALLRQADAGPAVSFDG